MKFNGAQVDGEFRKKFGKDEENKSPSHEFAESANGRKVRTGGDSVPLLGGQCPERRINNAAMRCTCASLGPAGRQGISLWVI